MLPLPAPAIACPAPIVHDGDTIRCGRGRSLRLARIDAPELAGSPRCRRPRRGMVCDQAAAVRSRDALKRMLAAGPVRYVVVDASPRARGFQTSDRYGRPVVRVFVGGRDVGEAMVRGGWAVRWPVR